MYSELSTQFQYNESEFNAAKTYEMLKVFCPICSTIFEQTKHQIRTNWRRSPSKVLYCTRTCSMLSRSKTERETDNCLHCNKEFIRVTTNIKSVNKKFCSKSCSATYMNINRTEEERDEISRKVSAKLIKKVAPVTKPKKISTNKKIRYNLIKTNLIFVYTLKYNINYIIKNNKQKQEKLKKTRIKKSPYTLICNFCKKEFTHKIKIIKYCSNNCLKQLKIKIKKQLKIIKYKKLNILISNVYTFDYIKCYVKYVILNKYYLSYCKGCNKPLIGMTRPRNVCPGSKECFKLLMRKVHEAKPHLILNRSNPESYLEKSFREYIENKGYIKGDTFIQEKQWKLSNGKRYISDFYFPNLNLIVEMDGKQHQNTIEEDELKDSLLKEEFNLDTIRITHKQWRYKEKAKVLESVL